jgi:hypothetical protein
MTPTNAASIAPQMAWREIMAGLQASDVPRVIDLFRYRKANLAGQTNGIS